jgi:hypothetical protein
MTTAVTLIVGAAGGAVLLGIVLLALRMRQASTLRPADRHRIREKSIETPPAEEPVAETIEAVPRRKAASESPRLPPEPRWTPHAIVIGDGDEKLATIEPLRTRRGWSVARDPRVHHAVETLVRGAPLLKLGGDLLSKNLYYVRLDPGVAAKVADGTWNMMRSAHGGIRANVVDARHIVRAQASLSPAVAAGAALAVWQVMAMVTAQKFLADIDRKLASLEKSVAAIHAWLEDDRAGKLRGNLAYLAQVAAGLRSHELTPEEAQHFVAQVEHVERECQQLEQAALSAMERHEATFNHAQLTGVGFEEHVQDAHREVNGFDAAARSALMALQVRGAACQLRAALPVSRQVTLERARAIAGAVEALEKRNQAFLALVNRRIPELRGKLTFDSTDEREQAKLRNRWHEVKSAVEHGHRQLAETSVWLTGRLEKLLSGESARVELAVKVDRRGKVVKVLERVEERTARAG